VSLVTRIVASAFVFLLPACATMRKPSTGSARASVAVAVEETVPSDWKQVASADDVNRISSLPSRWAGARAEAGSRYSKAIKAEGALLDPGAALDRPEPTPGRYRCRTVRIGKLVREPAYASFKAFFCFVSTQGPLLSFTKGTGTHRPGGWLWADGDKRLVFLGGFAEGTKGEPPPYRTGAVTNAIGVIERIDDFRWRLVLMGPPATNRIEVVELLPDTLPPTQPAQ